MTHAERCPVCGGSGEVAEKYQGTSSSMPLMRPCHGCGGKGWIVVWDEMKDQVNKMTLINGEDYTVFQENERLKVENNELKGQIAWLMNLDCDRCTLAAQQKEIINLTGQRDNLLASNLLLLEKEKAKDKQIEKLKAAIKRVGHAFDCEIKMGGECNCGLEEVLKEGEK